MEERLTGGELLNYIRSLTEDDRGRSVYTWAAMQEGWSDVGVFSLGAFFKYREQRLFERIPSYVLKFVNDLGEVLAMGSRIYPEGPVAPVIMRGITQKRFITYGSSSGLLFGMESLASIRYGTPVLLVEGVLDRAAMRRFYGPTLAILTASLTLAQMEVIEVLTNRVILMYDSDEAGQKGIQRDRKELSKRGIKVEVLFHPKGVSDAGTLLECEFKGFTSKAEALAEYYRQSVFLLREGGFFGKATGNGQRVFEKVPARR